MSEKVNTINKKKQLRIKNALELSNQKSKLSWIEIDQTKIEGKFKSSPERDELSNDINEQLIVELYSK